MLAGERFQELHLTFSFSAPARQMYGVAHHLKLVLPEFLLSRLIQEGKVADMVDKDVAE